jgi:hypothetical protein
LFLREQGDWDENGIPLAHMSAISGDVVLKIKFISAKHVKIKVNFKEISIYREKVRQNYTKDIGATMIVLQLIVIQVLIIKLTDIQ